MKTVTILIKKGGRYIKAQVPAFTKEEQKLFDENLPYALSLVHLYPKLDKGELSSIAYRALLQALRGYSMRQKGHYDASKASVKTLVNRIFLNEVNRYTKEEGKKKKREPYMEEVLKPKTEEGEEIPAEETIADLKTVMQETATEETLMKEQLKDMLSEEDFAIAMLMIENYTYNDIKDIINKKYNKEQTWQRYKRLIDVNIVPKLEQLAGEMQEMPETLEIA